VQNLLSSRVGTCAYDRAGLGWSEQGPVPRTMRQEVFELQALLEAAKVPRPYVLWEIRWEVFLCGCIRREMMQTL